MNNFNITDKKNLMKRKNATTNKKWLIIISYFMAFTIVFFNSTGNILGIDSKNDSKNPALAPNNTSKENNYCSTNDCETVCNDLRQAFASGNGEKIKTLTKTYPGSGDYCGF